MAEKVLRWAKELRELDKISSSIDLLTHFSIEFRTTRDYPINPLINQNQLGLRYISEAKEHTYSFFVSDVKYQIGNVR